MNIGIGPTKAQQLLSAIDLHPHAYAGLHLRSRKVGEKLVKLNEDDMQKKLLEAAGPKKSVHIATDIRLPKDVADAMKEADPTVCTERLSDITHFLQRQVKRAKKKEFSNGLFPGVRTKKMREQLKYKLAADLKNRTSLILRNVTKNHGADTTKIKTKMPGIMETVVKCYSGDCSHCPEWSAETCTGQGSDNWFTRSHSLSECRITALYRTDHDQRQIKDVLTLALGDEAIDKTKKLTSTQASECANHSLSVINPKCSRFPRTHWARTASQCLEWNNGPKLAAIKKKARSTGAALRLVLVIAAADAGITDKGTDTTEGSSSVSVLIMAATDAGIADKGTDTTEGSSSVSVLIMAATDAGIADKGTDTTEGSSSVSVLIMAATDAGITDKGTDTTEGSSSVSVLIMAATDAGITDKGTDTTEGSSSVSVLIMAAADAGITDKGTDTTEGSSSVSVLIMAATDAGIADKGTDTTEGSSSVSVLIMAAADAGITDKGTENTGEAEEAQEAVAAAGTPLRAALLLLFPDYLLCLWRDVIIKE
ncbi:hypothetical protein ACOMHN_022008 [Nucella lapillus]